MSDSIKQYMERPKFYANVDGTGEMGWGVCLLGLALVGYVQAMLPRSSVWRHGFYSLIFMEAVVIPFCCLGYFGPKAIKKYITYPRTGYVAYRGAKGFSWVRVALFSLGGAAIAAGIAGAIILTMRHNATAPLRLGMACMSIVSYCLIGILFARAQRWKWCVYGLLALLLAAIFLATTWKFEDAAQRAMLLAALTSIASGAVTFILYMRRTKAPASECE
jgi:hypothetical protein